MLRLLLRHLTVGYQRPKGWHLAMTLIELLLTLAILGTLSAIAVPLYTGHIDKQRTTTAIIDIKNIESRIERFSALSGRPPNNFAEAGIAVLNDPWGNPYQYLRIAGIDWKDIKHIARYDKFDKPINHDYDLYSPGRDKLTVQRIDKKKGYDDIIRANGGAYVGEASEF